MRVEVKNLCFSYGRRTVLDKVSFSAEGGELIALLGQNGAGKSTLMKCLLGVQKAYSGEILLDGCEVRTLRRRALAQKAAYIPQSAPLVFNYSVLDTVLMGSTGSMGTFAVPGAAQEEKAMAVLDGIGIAGLARRGCEELSGGERQLVLLARALVQDARLLVMDEPTANLDYGNQNRVMAWAVELAQRGYTVLFSTHDPNQALLYASRALTLRNGAVLTDGAPEAALTEEVLERLYAFPVRRHVLMDANRALTLCVPGERETVG